MKALEMSRTVGEGSANAGVPARPRILSLCCLYPNPAQPAQGVFVQRRLHRLAELAEVRVVAPVAMVNYGNPRGQRLGAGRRLCPARRQDGPVPVFHPRWFYLPSSGALSPLLLALQLVYRVARIRKAFAFDVLDTHFGYPEGVAGSLVSALLGVPFTMTLRGNEPKHSRGALERRLMRWSLRRASRVFTVSERLRQFAIGLGARPDRVITIPNGVDGEIFFPRDRAACRAKHGVPPDVPVILSAGALVERKGHHRIIQAVQSLARGGRAVQLLIAGGAGPEGAYESKLRQLVSALGLEAVVRLLGPLPADALAEVMCAADVFCLASTNEGWPNVVHEALACGTPVVATDVGAVPDMLAGGQFGVIVPVDDQDRLAAALIQALERPWDRGGISAWGRSRTWELVATEVCGQLSAVAAETRKRNN